MRGRRIASWLAWTLSLAACNNDAPPVGTDGGTDAGPPTSIDALPIDEALDLPGLEGPVDVVIDDRGVPHLYASTLHDLMMAQGYVMSRDRFGQMEFIRRNVLGRLAEVAGSLSPSLLDADYENRVLGYARMGRRIWDALQASTDPVDVRTREVAQAFVDGINAYIERARVTPRLEDPAVRGADALNLIVGSPSFGPWEPADVFAMARFQAMSLSYDAGADAYRTRALAGVEAAFGAADDPRRGAYFDLWSDLPARAVFTRDGWNDGTTSAFLPPALGAPPGATAGLPTFLPSRATLDGARGFFERLDERLLALGMGDEHRGSNNWLVSGALTASGHPLLANDPHLSLISPPVWWYVHLNTARMGGEDAVDAEGVAFAGLPGVVLGMNRRIAWGATTTGYDVTDVYLEEITAGVGGAPDTVRFDADGDLDLSNAVEVPITVENEEIVVAGMDAPVTRAVEFVPHHGPIVPGSRQPVPGSPGRFTALSVRYTGYDVSNELGYFVGLLTASNVAEAATAQDHFRVGSQNFIVIDRDHIRWSTEARIPQRTDRATDLEYAADGTVSGHCPTFVLPGTGGYEWTGDLPETVIPHDEDPARGFIATANQDNVGVTADGNPCNDAHYLGGDFDLGMREDHIVSRLMALTPGEITAEDMSSIQAETSSSTGATLRDALVAILGDSGAVAGLTAADVERVQAARARLMAWSLATPHGVGATDAGEIADSVATSVFNAAITRILPRALGDEVAAIGERPGSQQLLRWLENALAHPERLRAVDADGESVFWDDLTTADVTETKASVVVAGVLAGLDFLEGRLGANADDWRWGRLHTVRFDSVVPALGADVLSIPPADEDPFPRHGDFGAVDVGNFGVWDTTDFSHGSGASMRFVVEMTPDGPLAYNALPGGQRLDPDSPHHRDEAALWIRNEAPPLAFDERDVVSHAERRIRVTAP